MKHDILIVDDNPGMIRLMGRILADLGSLRFATSGAAALLAVHATPPDVVLLDAEMPGMSGYEVCQAMHADPALRDIPVIFVTAHSGPEFELRGLSIGAVDFIAKPISDALVVARVKTQLRLKSLADELRRVATVDGLTDLANRRRLDEALEREWLRAARCSHATSLLLVDVDHFKLFNDHYGHPTGDACLRSVAQTLRGAVGRPADVAARYGGEEFVLLLPETPGSGAEHVARRVLTRIEALRIPHEASPTAGHVTVSVGVACYEIDALHRSVARAAIGAAEWARKVGDLLECADKALYAAKSGGRARAARHDLAAAGSEVLSQEGALAVRHPTAGRATA